MIRLLTAVCFISLFANTSIAAPGGTDIPITAPPCNILNVTPSYTEFFYTNETANVAIVYNTNYYTYPCYSAVVQFVVEEKTFNNPYHNVYFDAISNELIDTYDKCESYKQETSIYRLEGNNNWTLADRGHLIGDWVGGKCKFKPIGNSDDFRKRWHQPSTSGFTTFRVATTVTTGFGPSYSPSNPPHPSDLIISRHPPATGRQICFAISHPLNNNTFPEGCADPVPQQQRLMLKLRR